jgi:nitrile hydratase
MAHHHDHSHDHEHSDVPSELALRVKALESLLVEHGYVDPQALDAVIETMETRVGPHVGAKLIAKAWVDADFKKLLLRDASAALVELGYEEYVGAETVVLENTPEVHNLVVCTLCSCYPWTVLGLPPVWYKSHAYRSRAVIDPRGVIRDFGGEVPEDVEVRVWDSTAELRFFVMPERPPGTEGMSEEELAKLVTRDHMVGIRR